MPPTTEAASATPAETKKEEKESKDKKVTKKEDEEPELSEEDKQLLDELNLCVERLQESDESLYKSALEILRTKIRSSTASITAVPKPLKFLRPHYSTLKTIHEKIKTESNKQFCADIISVLGMTISEDRECLKFRLVGSADEIGSWGHEYVRHISGEIASEWQDIDAEEADSEKRLEKLLSLVNEIIPYDMKHNAETEACDLLMEIEKLDLLLKYTDKTTYARVCLYLVSCVPYTAEPENTNLLRTAIAIFRKFEKLPEALRLAMQLNDMELIEEIFLSCQDASLQKQLAFSMRRQHIFLELNDEMDGADDLTEILSNAHLNQNFLVLARELDIMEPKVPEDIYKTHLENHRIGTSSTNVDSARMNLASSYVNGFVNAAFGQDKLLTEEGNKWIYKNKEHGMLATTASLGLVLLWDVDGGLQQIDKYLYSSEDYIKAGALLACGIVNTGVRNECDPALALLSDYVLHSSNVMRVGSILGLGLAYAGSNRMDLIALITPALTDPKSNMEVIGISSLALGLIAVGSSNGEVTSSLLQTLIERSESDLKDSFARFIVLALALVYLGRQESVETVLMALQVVPEPLKGFASVLVEVCAYAGTGNVLKIQQMLHICSETDKDGESEPSSSSTDKKEKSDKKKDSSEASSSKSTKKDSDSKSSKSDDKKSKSSSDWGMTRHAAAVLGIGLISVGEDIGSEMAFRMFGHLYRYGDDAVRRAVPLALALTSVSNPQLHILDTLSKFSHDTDAEVVHNSIFGMALVGAGTNNARLAQMLRNLAVYYSKDHSNLFLVRLAQGLVHLGKGTMTVQPYHSDRQLMSPVALAGILSVIISMFDVKTTILGKSHYLLYTLTTAMQPRMLVTFDQDLNPLPISVRVGQAVDVVGQAGKPKTITGFQTHTTPVLLAYGERAELATDEYIALTPVMEGFVILKKNPDAE